jgi:hypothetical protein
MQVYYFMRFQKKDLVSLASVATAHRRPIHLCNGIRNYTNYVYKATIQATFSTRMYKHIRMNSPLITF